MNTTEKAHSPKSSSAALKWDFFVGLLPLLGLSPMLLQQTAALWSRDYYRFFPGVFFVVAVSVIWRWRTASESKDTRRVWAAIGIFLLAVLAYAASVRTLSPSLAQAALIMVFAAWALGRLGNLHWATIGGWTALLATTLPLPWGWDRSFVDWLQWLGSWCSARALDTLAIPVLQNGGLIETRSMYLVADEVCGGFVSPYAFVAVAITLCMLGHSSFLVALKTVFLVPLWTVLGYFAEIFGILALQEYLGRDFSSGRDFLALEVGTTLLVLMLIWLTNRILKRLFAPIPLEGSEFGPLYFAVNHLFCWPNPDPYEGAEPKDDYEREQFRLRRAKYIHQRSEANFEWLQHGESCWSVRAVAVLFLVLALLPLRSLTSEGLSSLRFERPTLSVRQVEQLGNQETLPAALESGWQRVGFQLVQRNPRSRKGEFSLLWRYKLGQREFDVSLDLLFVGWNDPAEELAQTGWKVESTEIATRDGWPMGECTLENELGGKAIIFYSMITQLGEPYTHVPQSYGNEEEFQQASEPDDPRTLTTATYRIQLFSESGDELSSQDREALQAVFLELRKVLGSRD